MPCIAEIPELKALYEDLRDEGVEFISVNVEFGGSEKGRVKLRTFLEMTPMEWPQLQDDGWAVDLFKRASLPIPAKFIVDKEGILVSTEASRLPLPGSFEMLADELLALAKEGNFGRAAQ